MHCARSVVVPQWLSRAAGATFATAHASAGAAARAAATCAPSPTESFTLELASAVSLITGEPLARARALLQCSAHQNNAFQRDYEWLTAHDWTQTQRHIATCAVPQAADLHTALKGIGRPVILACTHSGNYLTGLLRVLMDLPDVQALTLIKRPAASEREQRLLAHIARLGIDVQVLRTAERPLLRALDALRQRRHVALMVDVPPSFGVTGLASAQLFNHPAQLPQGPAALAVAGRALLLPVTVHPSGRVAGARPMADSGLVRRATVLYRAELREAVQLGALIDAAPQGGEDRRAATERVHRALARQLCDWLKSWPESWMLWPHLPSYFVNPEHPTHNRRREKASVPP